MMSESSCGISLQLIEVTNHSILAQSSSSHGVWSSIDRFVRFRLLLELESTDYFSSYVRDLDAFSHTSHKLSASKYQNISIRPVFTNPDPCDGYLFLVLWSRDWESEPGKRVP